MRRTDDYDFELPTELVAQAPADRRDDSRLLVVGEDPSRSRDLRFSDLLDVLPERAVIVANDARVRPARLRCKKQGSGGAVELLLLEPVASGWRAMARASKPIRSGAVLITASGAEIRVTTPRAEDGSIVVELPASVDELCERDGELPLPPYIRRPAGPVPADRDRYQTVYASALGAIAAPTAGLHLTDALIDQIRASGREWATLTLHVGLGTFAPIRVDDLDDIELHGERYHIPEHTTELVASGHPVVAIGTTVVRALEAAAATGEASGETNIFISPGYRFRAVTHLVTNFHLPRSSLLMLVAAFAGYQRVMDAYRLAVARSYRFYSYGDAMLLSRQDTA